MRTLSSSGLHVALSPPAPPLSPNGTKPTRITTLLPQTSRNTCSSSPDKTPTSVSQMTSPPMLGILTSVSMITVISTTTVNRSGLSAIMTIIPSTSTGMAMVLSRITASKKSLSNSSSPDFLTISIITTSAASRNLSPVLLPALLQAAVNPSIPELLSLSTRQSLRHILPTLHPTTPVGIPDLIRPILPLLPTLRTTRRLILSLTLLPHLTTPAKTIIPPLLHRILTTLATTLLPLLLQVTLPHIRCRITLLHTRLRITLHPVPRVILLHTLLPTILLHTLRRTILHPLPPTTLLRIPPRTILPHTILPTTPQHIPHLRIATILLPIPLPIPRRTPTLTAVASLILRQWTHVPRTTVVTHRPPIAVRQRLNTQIANSTMSSSRTIRVFHEM